MASTFSGNESPREGTNCTEAGSSGRTGVGVGLRGALGVGDAEVGADDEGGTAGGTTATTECCRGGGGVGVGRGLGRAMPL